jgi:hypothetical protein
MSIRVMLDKVSPAPAIPATEGPIHFTVERDPFDYRGTGGLLRDLAEARYEDDDYLLVANGAQLIVGSLAEHSLALAERGGEVVVAGHRDGTPTGLMLVRCGALRGIPAAGFVDMKEQALPMIARSHDVRVVLFEKSTARPVRTLPDYLAALRAHHQQMENRPIDQDPFGEDLRSTFSVVEHGARVDREALLHDAVVLAGGIVEPEAVVVRSLICPGARVRRGQRVADRILAGPGAAARSAAGGGR